MRVFVSKCDECDGVDLKIIFLHSSIESIFICSYFYRHGLDMHGGFFIPADVQQTVIAERAACLKRVISGYRRLLESLFVSGEVTRDLLGDGAAWIKGAEARTTVVMALAVEFSVVQQRQPGQIGWNPLACPPLTTSPHAPHPSLFADLDLLTKPSTYRLHCDSSALLHCFIEDEDGTV